MRKQFGAAIIASIFLSAGCATPNYLYRKIHDSYDKNYEQALMKKYKDLNGYITNHYEPLLTPGTNQTEAKRLRNQVLTELTWLVDADYYRRKNNLFLNRAQFNLLTDLLVLGTTTAGTLTGGESIKTILSATSAGIVGARTSVDANIFRDKTSEALIGKMDAMRDNKKVEIINSMELDVAHYPLEEGIQDVHALYDRGTVVSAIVELSKDAATSAETAKKNLEKTKSDVRGARKSATPPSK